MGLNVGDLDTPVTIQALTESVGASRFPVESWTTLSANVFMYREDQRGAERFASGQLSAPVTTRWEMRYRADMDPQMVDVAKKRRLLYLNRIYDITNAEVIGRMDGVGLVTIARIG